METEIRIVNNGVYFFQPIIDIDDESTYIHNICNNDPEQIIQDIPINICIEKDGFKVTKESGITSNQIDNSGVKSWIFNYVCDNSSF